MAIYSKQLLSGSTDGKQILLSTTATPGNIIHTSVAGNSSFDEIWVYMTNNNVSTAVVTIEYGGTVNPNDNIIFSLASKQGLTLVIPGLILQNSEILRAFCSLTGAVSCVGFVNRIV